MFVVEGGVSSHSITLDESDRGNKVLLRLLLNSATPTLFAGRRQPISSFEHGRYCEKPVEEREIK